MTVNRPINQSMAIPSISRREMLRIAGVNSSAAAVSIWAGATAGVAADAIHYRPLNRFPRMVHEFYVRQARVASQRRRQQLDQLKTKADAADYLQQIRRRIRTAFGRQPPRTPLRPRITGTVEREEYRIENVIFDSRPNFPVTANLYLPKGRTGKRPGVVGTCGHSSNGKASEAYQTYAQSLAKLGFVCLIYDPIGQGERLQYMEDDLSSKIGVGVREHLKAGNQQFLVGEFFGMWRAWDGIRALDYLLTRPEVDVQRIGVTGNSGGGTMTTWLAGVESRWTMAAPSCFVSTFRRNLENELPQDTEQCPPRALALGLDHADFLAVMAPKPVIVLAKERDYFDVRGAEETYRQLRRLYRLLDAEDNVALFVGPTGHGYSQENREAMYSWFHRSVEQPGGDQLAESIEQQLDGVLHASTHLNVVPEPDVSIEPDETLWCTPNGQVGQLEKTRTVFDFTRDQSANLAAGRPVLRGSDLRRAIVDVLKIPSREQADAPDYRNWRYLGSRGYPSSFAMAYAVETEPSIHAIVYRLTSERWHSRPPRGSKQAALYVAHLSSDAELREEPLIRDLVEKQPELPVFTCDVRGIGESLPGTCRPGSFHDPYGSDYFYAVHALMLDRPYLGQKTFDVLRVLDWLASLGHTDVHLLGRGWGALAATFAAVLSDSVTRVTLKHALTSYADVAENEFYDWPLSTLPPNVLSRFDLPDCYGQLKAKNLRQIEPWDSSGKTFRTEKN